MKRLSMALLALAAGRVNAQCVQEVTNADPPIGWPVVMRGFNISGIKNNTIEDAHAYGANLLRLQVFPINRAMRWHKPLWEAWPIVLDSVEAAVKIAARNHMKVVVDLHEAPVEGVREDQPAMWNHPDMANNFCRAWADIARRLLPWRDAIWGYDIFNEPVNRAELPNMPKAWPGLAQQIINTIRSIDRQTWIVFESGPGSVANGLTTLKPFSDRRIVYSWHFYDPVDFTTQGPGGNRPAGSIHYGVRSGQQWDRATLVKAIQIPLDFQKKHHVPIFVGEFAVTRWAPHDDAVRWIHDAIGLFEQHHWSWAYHIFRDWNGWSLEVDDSPWKFGDPEPPKTNYVTDRGKEVKEGFARNRAR
jgi:aryl-phospho-beta-D-glucosidase BglC (GH1 family)